MSDNPASGQQPPGSPPPPPSAGPPPGYAAYDQAPSAGKLARVGGLAKALVVLVAIVGVSALVAGLLSGNASDAAQDYLDGRISEDEFLESFGVAGLLSFVQIGATVAAAVLTMIIMFRMAANHRSLGRRGTWAPGWGIGGWFLPPLVIYVIPFLMFRELWKASDPDAPHGSDQWKSTSVSLLVPVWWVLYGLVPLALIIAVGPEQFSGGFGGSTEDLAESIVDQSALTILSGVATLAAAVVYIFMIRTLAARHRRLTNES